MRHYDRAGYRHLDHGDRYRDPEYLGDDGWVGPNEHPATVTGTRTDRARSDRAPISVRPTPRYVADSRAAAYRPDHAPAYMPARPAPSYARVQERPSYEERGPRREPPPAHQHAPARPAGPGLVSSLLHPRQTLQRAIRGIFTGRGPKNWTRSDHRIHDEVCERLAHHSDVDATDIEVKVENGEVTLTGIVESRLMKYAAEDTAAEVMGVHDVHNRLRLASRERR
jgi:hypothetical protein